ncbi:right-handed parallel beta-helix repeat-containing protein, partial [Candidatus Woesearchaeota archaeon]|nr:right-handed parallel beta-helix repeat-containing protein [Candidatus Woesearchaeota archaeon]
MEKRDKGLVVLLLCLPLVLTLVFLGNSLDIFSVHSFNLLTGAAITGGSSTTILPDDPRIIDDSALNQSLPEDSSQPDHNSASEQNVGIAPTESSNPSSIGIQAEATSTSCGTVSSSLTLTSDVSNDTTCFTINANDLTLDCNGFTAHYGATGTGYGVNNTNGYDNITIRNCNLKKNGTSGSTNYGVYFTSSDNSTIYNSTIYTNGSSSNYGIFINFSVSLNISRNYISTNGTTTNYGIRFTQVNYTIINNNTIRTSGTSSQNEGVSLSTAVYNNFTNNDILTSGSSLNYGVASSTGNTGNNRYLWNNIVAAGTSSGDAFRLSASSNYFEGNIISSIASSSGYGLNLLGSGSANNVFLNNNFSSASSNSVIDNTGASSYNQIIYNNSYGQVVWNLTDLDCNLNNLKADNSTIFLSDNAIGILSSGGTSNKLLGVSTIEVRSLNYNTTPYLLRDGSRCDNTNNCNISYNNNTGLLSANVTVTGLFQALNSSAINYCQTITNTTTLVESVSSPSGCFVMNTSNVTLDCSGYSINYGGIGIGSAISAEYVGNITIKNCIITNTLIPITTDTAAIKFNGIDNSLIDNNTITLISNQSNYGVYTYGLSENITISNNTISNNGNDSDYVIYITNTMRNIQLLKNNLTRIYGKTNPYAVFFDNVEENTIHGNNINIIGTNNTVGGYGIYVTDRLNNITSNNITVSSSVGSYGIIVSNNGLYEISNMNISHNIVNINGSNSSSGIYLYYVTYNNSMAGNKVNFTSAGTNNAGIMMAIIDGLNFTNNSIYFGQRINNSEALNITTGNDLKIQNTLISMTNYSNIAIVIGSQTDDITITDTNVYNAFTLLKTSNSNNNVFINMNSSGSNDSSLYADSCSYADACVTTFINSSLGDYYSIDSTNLIYVKWYVNVNVSNATGEPVSLVNVTGYNVINNLDDTNLTDSNGLTRLELTEYYLLDNVKYYTSGNHTIKAFLANYTLGTGEINLINHSGGLVNITINKFSCGNKAGLSGL